MAAPTFRSVANDTGSANNFTATEPSGAASGDGLLFVILVALAHSSFVNPTDWTPVPSCNALDAGSDFTAYMFYLQRGGVAPSLAVSWTTSQYYEWSLYAFQNVSGASFIDTSAATASTSTATPDPPSVTTTGGVDTLICAVAYTWAGFQAPGATPPAGYTLRFGDTDYDHALATLETSGTVNPGSFSNTYGAGNSRAMTVALAGTGGGGGGGEVAPVDHSSVLSFPALCRKPKNNNGRWTRGKGGLWVPNRRAA